jgi:hypothetical protein
MVVSPPVSEVEESAHPPTAPDVADIAPVEVTLNGAAAPVEWPSQSRYVASVGDITATLFPEPAVITPAFVTEKLVAVRALESSSPMFNDPALIKSALIVTEPAVASITVTSGSAGLRRAKPVPATVIQAAALPPSPPTAICEPR